MRLASLFDFPESMSEDDKILICRQLDIKDQEIRRLESKIDELDYKYNGGLTYSDAEKLKTQVNIMQFTSNSITRELEKYNLKLIQYYPKDSPNVYEIKIIKDKNLLQLILSKLGKILEPLMFFEIKRKVKSSDS